MSDNPVPTPLRAVAGLAAVAIDEARRLPNRLVALPVLAVGGAMQASVKIQQGYTELATRGDQLLSQLRGGQPETPPWARFDEDDFADEADPDTLLDDVGLGDVGAEQDEGEAAGDESGLPVANYDSLSIPQLRSRLRRLTAEDVEVLVTHERATQNRAPYLTMLENRLAALRGI